MNVSLCLFFGITVDGSSSASQHLLVIFIINFAFYYTYYSIMKVCYKERLDISSCIYFGCCMMLMIPSIYFFSQVEASVFSYLYSKNFYCRKRKPLPYHQLNPGIFSFAWNVDIIICY